MFGVKYPPSSSYLQPSALCLQLPARRDMRKDTLTVSAQSVHDPPRSGLAMKELGWV